MFVIRLTRTGGVGPRMARSSELTESPAAETGTEASPDDAEATATEAETTVTVRCTGHVRTELGVYEFEFTFEGDTFRAFLDELFEEYPQLQEMLIAETEEDATHTGWAPTPEELPGT